MLKFNFPDNEQNETLLPSNTSVFDVYCMRNKRSALYPWKAVSTGRQESANNATASRGWS